MNNRILVLKQIPIGALLEQHAYDRLEWQREVRIRRQNSKNLSKTFINKEDAQRWAREQESKLDKGIFEDLTAANNILLKDLINR